jgi:hypothetical protein
MIDGVTLLSKSIECNGTGWLVFSILFIFITLFPIVNFLGDLEYKKFNWKALLVSIIGILLIITGFYLNAVNAVKYTQYKVTISDSVNFNDFNSKYNIVSQEGKIYTIVDKTESNDENK